jgi:hypothetical protein
MDEENQKLEIGNKKEMAVRPSWKKFAALCVAWASLVISLLILSPDLTKEAWDFLGTLAYTCGASTLGFLGVDYLIKKNKLDGGQ